MIITDNKPYFDLLLPAVFTFNIIILIVMLRADILYVLYSCSNHQRSDTSVRLQSAWVPRFHHIYFFCLLVFFNPHLPTAFGSFPLLPVNIWALGLVEVLDRGRKKNPTKSQTHLLSLISFFLLLSNPSRLLSWPCRRGANESLRIISTRAERIWTPDLPGLLHICRCTSDHVHLPSSLFYKCYCAQRPSPSR